MSVIGIDIGTDTCVVSIARRGGVDVLANETSSRSTPCMVAFSGKERRMGEAAKSQITSNIKNTFTALKKIIGKRYASEAIQTELQYATYSIRDVAGDAQVQFQYADQQHTWRVERVMGMMLNHMRQIAEANNEGKPVTDCVISIPPYWTDCERQAMMQAAEIVGLNVLKLMHDTSAAALAYGIYKTELPDEANANHVMIFDLGHGDTTVSICAFSKGKLVVKAVASETVGARDLDMLVARHCAAQWKEKHKIDAFTSPKATFRLLTACEKLRKTLSTISHSTLAIECFMEDIDVQAKVERAEFEEWAEPWLNRIMACVDRCMQESGVPKEKLFSCEVIGGGSRIPCVAGALKNWLGRELSRTLNADEAVARGLALQGAMLSPAFRVRDFSINEVNLYPITVSWANSAGEAAGAEAVSMETDDAPEGGVSSGAGAGGSEVFTKMNSMPCTKMLTLWRSTTFALAASYAEGAGVPPGTPSKIADFTVTGLPLASKAGKENGEAKSKVKVKLRLDGNGMLVVESAQAIDEKEVEVWEDAPTPAAAPAAAAAEAAPAAEGAPTAAPAAAEGATPAEPQKVKKVKKKTERHNLPVEASRWGAMMGREVLDAKEEEGKMAIQDRILIETAEKMNALEAYVYKMRADLSEALGAFSSEAERGSIMAQLEETENWLYEDGAEAEKAAYEGKHKLLLELCGPITARSQEAEERPAAVKELLALISKMEALAASADTEHIAAADKSKATEELAAAKSWLDAEQAKQDALPKSADPTLLVAQLRAKCTALEASCAVLKAPKPAPKPAEPAASAGAPAASAADGDAAPAAAADAPAAAADGMDID